MNYEEKNKQLENRVEELEYRISILEKYIDSDDSILLKNDQSLVNSTKIWIKDKLEKKGYNTKIFKNRIGKKFYLED